jgi:Tfp pilus assembly protein PilP
MSSVVKRWVVLGSLLMITLVLVYLAPEEEAVQVVAAVKAKKSALRTAEQQTGTHQQLFIATAPVRKAINETPYDLFGYERAKVKKKVVRQQIPKPVVKSVKQRAPRLAFKYIGMLAENNQTKVFLMDGEALHLVEAGDKIGNSHQLKTIEDDKLTFVYLPLSITQTISIEKTP